MANSRLEDYIESATAWLPESERALEQQEIRQHLTALIAAHEERSGTKEAATDAALQQLGDAHQIRQQFLKTHRRAKYSGLMHRPLSEFWTAFGATVVFGPVVGGGVLEVLSARGRLPLRTSSVLLSWSILTAAFIGFGSMVSENRSLIAALYAIHCGLLLGSVLVGLWLGNAAFPAKRDSSQATARSQNFVKPLIALGSAALILGGTSYPWEMQQQEKLQLAGAKVRIAEAHYFHHLQESQKIQKMQRKGR